MPRTHSALFDWLVLKPAWLGLLALAAYYCVRQDWLVALVLALAAVFAVGGIAASLHKSAPFGELAAGHPSRHEAFGVPPAELSDPESRAMARALLRLAIILALTAAGLALHHHVRWYFAALLGFLAAWLGPIVLLVPLAVVYYRRKHRE